MLKFLFERRFNRLDSYMLAIMTGFYAFNLVSFWGFMLCIFVSSIVSVCGEAKLRETQL